MKYQFSLSAGRGCDSPVLLACSHPHEAGLFGGHRRGHRIHVHFHPRMEHLGDADSHGAIRLMRRAYTSWTVKGELADARQLSALIFQQLQLHRTQIMLWSALSMQFLTETLA